jgi:hypothetical protein
MPYKDQNIVCMKWKSCYFGIRSLNHNILCHVTHIYCCITYFL